MKNRGSHYRRSVGLSLLLSLFLAGWLYLPERFRFSPWRSASAATTFTVVSASDGPATLRVALR
jgi:hypothetical protein